MGVRDSRVVGACSSIGRVICVSSGSVKIYGIAAESRWIQKGSIWTQLRCRISQQLRVSFDSCIFIHTLRDFQMHQIPPLFRYLIDHLIAKVNGLEEVL